MIRASTALWAAAVIVVGYAMFEVKYDVMQQEDQLQRINHKIAASREAVRVLNAEWSFLTQPSRLNDLAKRYLDLVPIGTQQLTTIAAIPLRGAEPQDIPPPPPPKPQLASLKPGAER
jgi:cell division protein FtsL